MISSNKKNEYPIGRMLDAKIRKMSIKAQHHVFTVFFDIFFMTSSS